MQGYKQTEYIITKLKKAGMVLLLVDRIDFETRSIDKPKEDISSKLRLYH